MRADQVENHVKLSDDIAPGIGEGFQKHLPVTQKTCAAVHLRLKSIRRASAVLS